MREISLMLAMLLSPTIGRANGMKDLIIAGGGRCCTNIRRCISNICIRCIRFLWIGSVGHDR